jgi:hypothetical protein
MKTWRTPRPVRAQRGADAPWLTRKVDVPRGAVGSLGSSSSCTRTRTLSPSASTRLMSLFA